MSVRAERLAIDTQELIQVLEPLIRRVVREELALIVAKSPNVFYLEPDSPLYEDLERILREKRAGYRLLSREEALGD